MRRAVCLAALLVLAAHTAGAKSKPASPPAAEITPEARYDQCLATAHSDPGKALGAADHWRDGGGGFPAQHCAAVALIGLKRYAEAAHRLEAMAGAMMGQDPGLRADALEQAGQAWLLGGKPGEAKLAFAAALSYRPDDPDLLIDRAQAAADGSDYVAAIDDLSRAIAVAPDRADALVFRASAYRRVPDGLDRAAADVEHALSLDPNAVAGLLERGNIRALKGDPDGAAEDWRRVESMAPKSEAATAAKKNLAHLAAASDATPAKPK